MIEFNEEFQRFLCEIEYRFVNNLEPYFEITASRKQLTDIYNYLIRFYSMRNCIIRAFDVTEDDDWSDTKITMRFRIHQKEIE